jgi:mercuric reductase
MTPHERIKTVGDHRVELQIEGMTCEDCAASIERALAETPGVRRATVTFPTKLAVVEGEGLEPGALTEAVESAGYRAAIAESARAEAGSHQTAPHLSKGHPDLVVLGGGSAGFAAAIRAAELGVRVTLVEGGTLGGTCANVGCVPSKTLLRAADLRHRAAHNGFDGIGTTTSAVDFSRLMAQKDALVASLRQDKYANVLAAYPGVTLRRGRGYLNHDGSLSIGAEEFRTERLVVTTGASAWAPPIPGLAEAGYLTSTEALSLAEIPTSLIVLGGSAVGLELGQLFARLGSRVSILEAMPRLVPSEDAEVASELAALLRQEGLEIRTGISVERVSRGVRGYELTVAMDGRADTLVADALLVATGRRANTSGFGLEHAGIALGAKDEIKVDEFLATTRSRVYAAGDVIGDPMFVYVAAYGGALAAENAINGHSRRYDLTALPRVTFTDPQVASVGMTDGDAHRAGLDAIVARLPLSHVPRAQAAHDTRGFIKLVADRATGHLLGAQILAPDAGEMIAEPALALRHALTVTDLAAAFHPYLTLPEGVKLAALAFTKDVSKLSCCAV